MIDRSTGSQRVRIGLTGLGAVFVLVLLAAAFGQASDEEPITPDRIEEAAAGESVNLSVSAEALNEPLAELGVAPGNSPDVENGATNETVIVEDPLRAQRRTP